jgi:hypothetical protein
MTRCEAFEGQGKERKYAPVKLAARTGGRLDLLDVAVAVRILSTYLVYDW